MDINTVKEIIKIIYSTLKTLQEEDKFESIVNLELNNAMLYLKNATKEAEIRSGLIHMENAVSHMHSKSFDQYSTFSIVNVAKSKRFNELCYYTARLHYELNSNYSIILYFANKLALFGGVPEGFVSILAYKDYEYICRREQDAIEQKDSDRDFMLDWWSQPVI